MGVSRMAGRTFGELVSNTKVIADTIDLFTRGEHFLEVREMGRPERPEGTEMVVRRHRMMGQRRSWRVFQK